MLKMAIGCRSRLRFETELFYLGAHGGVMKGCMAQRGYVLVLPEDAAAKTAEFRTLAEASAHRQPVDQLGIATSSLARF